MHSLLKAPRIVYEGVVLHDIGKGVARHLNLSGPVDRVIERVADLYTVHKAFVVDDVDPPAKAMAGRRSPPSSIALESRHIRLDGLSLLVLQPALG